MTTSAEQFEQQLASQGQAYQLVTPLDQAHCHFRFSGSFLGERIIWDAYLQTLAYYVRNHALGNQGVRQYIDVGETGEFGRLIHIGLNLPVIDHASILKTLVMVRQYKRLAPGRHDFGGLHYFD